MWLQIAFLLIITGCQTKPSRMFNADDLQDTSCYYRYGGKYGYCDRIIE